MDTAVDLSMTDRQGERENDIPFEYEGYFFAHLAVCKVQMILYVSLPHILNNIHYKGILNNIKIF